MGLVCVAHNTHLHHWGVLLSSKPSSSDDEGDILVHAHRFMLFVLEGDWKGSEREGERRREEEGRERRRERKRGKREGRGGERGKGVGYKWEKGEEGEGRGREGRGGR